MYALIGGGASIVLTLPLIGFSIFSASLDRAPIRANIEQAFATGELRYEDFLRTNTEIGSHQFNDCLIMMMLVDDRTPTIERALSPLAWTREDAEAAAESRAPTRPMCERLSNFLDGSDVPAVAEKEPYHRYLHGHTALAGVMLSALPLPIIRHVFSFTMCLALVTLIVLAVRRASKARADTLLVSALDISVAGTGLLLFFGLPYFSQSLSHFPADILLVGYLGCVLVFDMSRWSILRISLLHAGFGVLTAYFEFLTGGIPLGLCLVFIGFAAHGLRDANYDVLGRAMGAAAAFIAGVLGAFITKLGLTVAVNGPSVITEFMSGLAHRTIGDASSGANYPWDAARAVAAGAYEVGSGWAALGILLLGASAVIFAYALFDLWRTRRAHAPPSRTILLILACLSVYLWWAVFAQHTVQHYFFMARIGVGSIIASALLAATIFHESLIAGLRHALRHASPARDRQEDRPK